MSNELKELQAEAEQLASDLAKKMYDLMDRYRSDDIWELAEKLAMIEGVDAEVWNDEDDSDEAFELRDDYYMKAFELIKES